MRSSFELLVGSRNRAKAAEIRRLLSGLSVTVLDLSAFDETGDVAEVGATFEENAVAKAAAFARMTGVATVADDSGLEVDALGGRPGIRSARFAGPHATDEENNLLLLDMLRDVSRHERTARFRSAIAFATPQGPVFTCEGSVEGVIVDSLRGTGGFGYDPLFFVAALGATFGEVDAATKDSVSHRGRALCEFRRFLAEYIGVADR